jgi:hypothetical protein
MYTHSGQPEDPKESKWSFNHVDGPELSEIQLLSEDQAFRVNEVCNRRV